MQDLLVARLRLPSVPVTRHMRPHGVPVWVLTVTVGVCALGPTTARARPCEAAAISPDSADREAVFAEANALARRGEFPEARALYAWLLEVQPDHHDALLAVARLDIWEACGHRAEDRYRSLLQRDPRDAEARAGLADVLLWSHRWTEADAVIQAGLQLDRRDAELWKRRARMLLWTNDVPGAIEASDQGLELVPDDGELREFRDRLYRTQLRVALHADWYPPNYLDRYQLDFQLMHRWRKFELTLGSQIGRYGAPDHPIIDARHSITWMRHFDSGVRAGFGFGFGAPARTVPIFEAKAFVVVPLLPRLSGSLTYSLWAYQNDKRLHIWNPALTYELTDTFRIDLRGWTTLVVLPPLEEDFASSPTDWTQAVSVGAAWDATADTMFGASYTWGPELDQDPSGLELLSTKAHHVTLFADLHWDENQKFGFQPLFAIEWRQLRGREWITILSAELAAYVRF
jgi:tetratricopeptide (TPR) repeat protein